MVVPYRGTDLTVEDTSKGDPVTRVKRTKIYNPVNQKYFLLKYSQAQF